MKTKVVGRLMGWIAAIGMATAVAGCGDDDNTNTAIPPADNSQIGGNVVLFSATLNVVAATPDVKVTATGPVTVQATTDADGDFVFVGLPVGEYTLTFEYNGQVAQYLGANGQPVIIVVGANERVELTDVLINNGTVTVRVTKTIPLDQEGNPLEDPMPLTPPVLVSPVNGAELDYTGLISPYSALLVWEPVTNVDHYVVQVEAVLPNIAKVPAGALLGVSEEEEEEPVLGEEEPVLDQDFSILSSSAGVSGWTPYVYNTTYDASYTLSWSDPQILKTRIAVLTNFRWRIWAVDGDNNVSQPSEWYTFGVQTAPSLDR